MSSLRILSILVVCLLQDRLPYEGTIPAPALIPRLDFTCILRTWRIKGVLYCGIRACLWVENAYPCGILEVVRQTGKSHMPELSLFGTRRTTSGHNESQLQFAESRVVTFVPPITQAMEIPIAAPPPQYQINYLSELDAFGWRTGLLDLLFAFVPDCAGNWGCFYPRSGYLQQQSEVLAAHLQALRGGRVASMPFGRVVIMPYEFEPRMGHYLQMVSPVQRSCVSIGHPDLRFLETGTLSPFGAYLFAHWGLFEECRGCLPPRLLPPRPPGP